MLRRAAVLPIAFGPHEETGNMDVRPVSLWAYQVGSEPPALASARELDSTVGSGVELREKFQELVAGTFLQLLLRSLRKTVGESKLVHGGRAEEIFRSQLDQTVATELARTHGSEWTEGLFEQFRRRFETSAQPATEIAEHDDRTRGDAPLGIAGDPE